MPDPDRLKLGKGVAFVKSHLVRLPVCDEVWEADFRALPVPTAGVETASLGLVVTRQGAHLLADEPIPGEPGVNDLARLLANAMRRPLDGQPRRPKTILLRANPRWRELIPVLESLKVGVTIEKRLPKLDRIVTELIQELRTIERTRMIRPDADQAKMETAFPAIAAYVRGHGFIEVGDQDGFGFVARAIGYGGVDFESQTPETLAEAMAVLETSLARWFEQQGIGIQRGR